MNTRNCFLLNLVTCALVIQGGSAAGAQESWRGASVLPARPATEIKFGDVVQNRQVFFPFSGRWPIRVREERDAWLRIFDGHREGWAFKADFVPVSDAVGYFSRRIEADPMDIFALLMRGAAWEQKGQSDNAIKDFDACIRLNPTAAIFFNSRANAWKARKDFDKAIPDYDEAIRLDPKYALAIRNRGDAWSEKKEYDKAIRDFDEAIRLDPKFALAFCNRGDAWSEKKDYDKALRDYDEAIRLDAKFARAFYGKACCDALQGRTDRAVENLGQALEVGYRDFNYIAKDRDLDSIRGDPRYQELLKKFAK